MSNISESDITLRPVDVFYGLRQKTSIVLVDDVTGSLNNTYFVGVNTDIDGTTTTYYVWYNINSAGSDPAISGATGVEVAGATNATAETLATATVAAIDASALRLSAVVDTASADKIYIENGAMGAVTATADTGSTGFTFAADVTGEKFEFGATADCSMSPEFSFVDVTASQLGATLLDQIQNGNNVTVTVPAKEVTATMFQETLGSVAGDTRTVGSDVIVGIGESQRFQNMKSRSKELMLRPANETNLVNTWTFWKAKPSFTDLNFSGEELQTAGFEFSMYRDSNRPTTVSLAAFGKSDKKMLA
jgi:hypothetical protein